MRGDGLPDTRLRPHQAGGGRVHYPSGGGKEQQRYAGQAGRAIRAQVHRGRSCPRQSNGKLDSKVSDVVLLQGQSHEIDVRLRAHTILFPKVGKQIFVFVRKLLK